jgi:hypothetical protein
MEKEALSPTGQKLLSCIEFDDDEKLLYEIRKHPFGLFMIYLGGLFFSGMMFLIAFVGNMLLGGDSNLDAGFDPSAARAIILGVGLVLGVLAIIVTFIAAYLYQSNVVVVTSDKVAQFLYPSLFNRKISQLSLGDIQDVTVTQKGILPHLFNYGTLVVETAGEQNNYIFSYTPEPYKASTAIVGAHEANLKLYGN